MCGHGSERIVHDPGSHLPRRLRGRRQECQDLNRLQGDPGLVPPHRHGGGPAPRRDPRPASIAANTGVDSADEVIKYLLVGADAVMTTSSLLRHGIDHMATLLNGLRAWLEARGFDGVASIGGRMSQPSSGNGATVDGGITIKALQGSFAAR